jgi:hypothetical protein
MRHARDDYNRIQDPAGLIPEDEPVFLLRGQDRHAAHMLRHYATLCQDQEMARLTLEQAERMEAWPRHKEPDL